MNTEADALEFLGRISEHRNSNIENHKAAKDFAEKCRREPDFGAVIISDVNAYRKMAWLLNRVREIKQGMA